MQRIERAIILAAGKGTRLRPVTNVTPKPLIKINGRRMLDTVVDALHENGIEEIYLVTGYLKEQFEQYAAEHPGIVTIENPYFETSNNISSAYVAREHIRNAFITEADFIINNPAIFRREIAYSGYCALKADPPAEWGLTLDAAGRITACATEGGSGSHQLIGISFWNEADGARLQGYIERAFDGSKASSIYWDEIAILQHPEAFSLGIREIQKDDVSEIDCLQELAAADSTYKLACGKGE